MTGVFRYWRIGRPIPSGWAFHSYLPGNHGRYSILIVAQE